MREHYDANEALDVMLAGLVADVEALVEFLSGLPAQAWTRESRHAVFGAGFTMQTWVERGLVHIEEHLSTLKELP
jgi:hypothetical protein